MKPGRIITTAAVAGAICLVLAGQASAQEITFSLGEGGSLSARTINLILLITVLSIAPGIAMMATSFPFLVTVLAILRQGIGLQQSPPNMLLVSLALFLTYFVMEPTFSAAWNDGIAPMMNETVDTQTGLERAIHPFRVFMANRVDPDAYFSMADLRPELETDGPSAESPLSILVPSFILSELSRAFQIGFIVVLPFLIIDLVVSAVLMSMGMMMVPPTVVALPFKLAFFVVADGWTLLARSLVEGYAP